MQKFSKVPLSSLCQDFVPLLPPKGNSLNFRDLVQSDKQIPTNKIIPTPKTFFRYLLTKTNFLKKKMFFEPAWEKQFSIQKNFFYVPEKPIFYVWRKSSLYFPEKGSYACPKKHVFKTKMIRYNYRRKASYA